MSWRTISPSIIEVGHAHKLGNMSTTGWVHLRLGTSEWLTISIPNLNLPSRSMLVGVASRLKFWPWTSFAVNCCPQSRPSRPMNGSGGCSTPPSIAASPFQMPP